MPPEAQSEAEGRRCRYLVDGIPDSQDKHQPHQDTGYKTELKSVSGQKEKCFQIKESDTGRYRQAEYRGRFH